MSRRHLKYLTRDFWKCSSFKVVTARQLGSVSSVFFYGVLQTDWRADKSDWTQTRIFNYVWSKRMFNENADTDITSSIWLFLQSNYAIKIITENMPLPPARQKENRSTIYRDKMLKLLEISLIKYSCIFFIDRKARILCPACIFRQCNTVIVQLMHASESSDWSWLVQTTYKRVKYWNQIIKILLESNLITITFKKRKRKESCR